MDIQRTDGTPSYISTRIDRPFEEVYEYLKKTAEVPPGMVLEIRWKVGLLGPETWKSVILGRENLKKDIDSGELCLGWNLDFSNGKV